MIFREGDCPLADEVSSSSWSLRENRTPNLRLYNYKPLILDTLVKIKPFQAFLIYKEIVQNNIFIIQRTWE